MVIIIAPGPSVLFVIARAIAWGRKTAVLTVAGNVTGSFVLSVFVALGLGPILQRSELAYIGIQWAGGLYLIYLGIDAIKHRQIHAADMTKQGYVAPGILRSIRDCFWVGLVGFTRRHRPSMASHAAQPSRKVTCSRWNCHDYSGFGRIDFGNCQWLRPE